MQPNSQTAPTGNADGALTVEEFCRCFSVGRTTVYEEINSGRLVARKRGSRTLIARDEARRWFHSLPPVERVAAVSA
jgi:excisionase family DNA binding protein